MDGREVSGPLDVEFREGSDGEWTCSGCDAAWCMETETPDANGYKFCPACGGKIVKYESYHDPLDEPEEEEEEDKTDTAWNRHDHEGAEEAP